MAFMLAAIIAGPLAVTAAYAQNGGMRGKTSGGSLDILVEPTWSPGASGSDSSAKFKVSFLNPDTDQVHQHQDYDFRIMQGNNQVFSAAKQTGQALLHNVEGTITVPYDFKQQGDYTIEVYLGGTGFGPTLIPTDETAKFQIKVTPEFPAGALGAIFAAMAATAIVATRRLKL